MSINVISHKSPNLPFSQCQLKQIIVLVNCCTCDNDNLCVDLVVGIVMVSHTTIKLKANWSDGGGEHYEAQQGPAHCSYKFPRQIVD